VPDDEVPVMKTSWLPDYARRLKDKWPFWGLPLLFLIIIMLNPRHSPTDADTTLLLIFYSFAIVMYLSLLPFNLLNPLSVLRWLLPKRDAKAEIRDIVGVALFLGVMIGTFLLVRGIIALGHHLDTLVTDHGGHVDANTMTVALTTSVLALMIAATCAVLTFVERRYDAQFRSKDIWVELAWALALIAVALVPSALLAAWTWNVIAAIIVPIVVTHARVDYRRYRGRTLRGSRVKRDGRATTEPENES
jgi:hypothetical protein